MNEQEINKQIKDKITFLNNQDDTFKNNFDEWMLIFTILFLLQHPNTDLSNLFIVYKNMKKLSNNNVNDYNDIILHIIKKSNQPKEENIKFEKIKNKTCFYELSLENTNKLNGIQEVLINNIISKIKRINKNTTLPTYYNTFQYLEKVVQILDDLISNRKKPLLSKEIDRIILEYNRNDKIEYEIIKNILLFNNDTNDKDIITKTITLMQQNKTLPHLKEFKLIIKKMLLTCENDNNEYLFLSLNKLLPNNKTNVYNKTDINTMKIQKIINMIDEAKKNIKIGNKKSFIKKQHPYDNKPLDTLKHLIKINDHDIETRTYIALEIIKQLLNNDNIDTTILNEIIKYTDIVCEYIAISDLTINIVKLLQEIVYDTFKIDKVINEQNCLKHILGHENVKNKYTTKKENDDSNIDSENIKKNNIYSPIESTTNEGIYTTETIENGIFSDIKSKNENTTENLKNDIYSPTGSSTTNDTNIETSSPNSNDNKEQLSIVPYNQQKIPLGFGKNCKKKKIKNKK